MLKHALRYAATGIPVFPLSGKKPLVKWGEAATTDEDTIRRWWTAWPDAGIGAPTGAPSGCWVLDIDVHHDGDDSLLELQQAHDDLPETATVRTGGGGTHYWWLLPPRIDVRNSASKVAPGIDVRGEGGFAVLPPSLHASGNKYAWITTGKPQPAPRWLIQLVTATAEAHDAPRADVVLPDGRRDDRLFALGCALRELGLDEGGIYAALEATNKEQCRPPKRDAVVRRIATQAAKYVRGNRAVEKHEARQAFSEWSRERPPFERGDCDVVLARELIAEMTGEAGGVAPLVDEGRCWRWNATTWASVEESSLHGRVSGYAGRDYWKQERASNGKTKKSRAKLALKWSRVKGSASIAMAELSRKGWFREARPGFSVQNGFVLLDEGKARMVPHDPSHRSRASIAWGWDPKATAPQWEQFLLDVFSDAGDEDRTKSVMLLQEFAGACLTGIATDYQTCLVLYGPGGNGKSTAMKVLRAKYPPGAVCHVRPQDFNQDYKVALLPEKRLNIVGEIPDGDLRGSDMFKDIVDGEPVTARMPHKEPFSFEPKCGHLFSCNLLPGSQDHSPGYWRRFMVLPFTRRFDDTPERDVDLADRIIAAEMGGVINWAIRGAERLRRTGRYTIPERGADAWEKWRHAADQTMQFVDACCQVVPSRRDGATAMQLYEEYVRWSTKVRAGTLSKERWTQRLALSGHMAAMSRGCRRFKLRIITKSERTGTESGETMEW